MPETLGRPLSSALADRSGIPFPKYETASVKGERIEKEGLRSGGPRKEVIRVRRIVYPGRELALYLGVRTAAVNRLAAWEEFQGLFKYA